jgi:catechol 2,3-dioxygenase-like lactoylglutathione lyase family enzyme
MTQTEPFPTETRVHGAWAANDLEASVAFYQTLLGQEPSKRRPGYAKFEVLSPALNLTLNETQNATAPELPQHFGIQVKTPDRVAEWADRFEKAGVTVRREEQVSCCYAVQNKVWATDPTGHSWEVFVVTDPDVDQYAPGDSASGCCADAKARVDTGKSCCDSGCC